MLNLLNPINETVPDAISVLSGADNNYAIGLAITLYSTLINLSSGSSICFYILDGGISDDNKQRLSFILERDDVHTQIIWLAPDLNMLKGVKIIPQFGITTYFRLLAPALLPQDLDRVIYLDSDLVIEKNLANLWTLELGDAPMLAVQDYLLPTVSLPCALKETYQTLHLSPDAAYCNCGVMLINLKKWREEDLSRNVLEYTQKYYDFVYCADQDGINAVTCGKWKALDVRWNVQVFGAINPRLSLPHQSAELIKQAHILHFTTRLKPWHYNYRQAGSDRFAYYLHKSNWLNSSEYISWLLKVRIPQFAIHSLAIVKRILQKK